MDSNLALHANPCCGYETDAAADVADLAAGPTRPGPGDLGLCLNCGALLVYTEPEANRMRYASRRDVARLPDQLKAHLARMQRLIRARGVLEPEARRLSGN